MASCDADGVVKLWDARMVAEIGTMEAGQHPLNSVCLDRSATRLAAASNDGTIKVTPCLQGCFRFPCVVSIQTPTTAVHKLSLPPRTERRTGKNSTLEPKGKYNKGSSAVSCSTAAHERLVSRRFFLSTSTHPVCISSTFATAT